ncbi:MAG: molybdopterin-dependent oxidoreductase [Dehalococcoidales bacterium]|nr:molybdopterin-dependent oxidoreductase [Dehalococcoidales bacterium]MDP7525294.1 molybdopterin-dependent oxidoreductase [Dehalococcoidales bacterium]
MTAKKREIVRTTTWSAGPGCHGGCGVLAHIEDGKLVKIEGDSEHPWNQGRLCSRCLAMTQYVYQPDRLTRPLKRVGERGEGKWQEISWDEAFDLIEEKMGRIREEFGPESVIFSMGTGRDIGAWICMLAYAYGSPNVMFALSGIACYSPRMSAVETVQGDYCVLDAAQWFPERYNDSRYKVPECIVIWGYDIAASCPDNVFGHWIIDLMKKGTKIIAIDPRLSWFASRAEKWIRLRPGTDGALAMAFLNVIINEGLYDREFVEKWTNAPYLVRGDTGKLLRETDLVVGGSQGNFVAWDMVRGIPVVWDSDQVAYKSTDAKPAIEGEFEVNFLDGTMVPVKTVWTVFVEQVNEYPVERVSEITWVPQKDIVEAARLYAKSKPAAIHWGVPIDSTPAVTPTSQAIANLWCITGNLDVPGGNVISRYAFDAVAYALPGAKGVIKLDSKEVDLKRIGADRYGPLREFIWRAQTDLTLEQIFSEDPYPIKGIWLQACNIVAGTGMDPKKWAEAFKKLDFVVAVDLFMTPTTQLADVVLPAGTFLEKDSIRSWWVPLQSINKAITVDECKPDIEINFELAKRFDPNFRWNNINDLFDDIIEPSGMTFKELQQKGWVMPPEGHPSHPYHRFQAGLLRPDRKPGFQTPSGKIELYSTLREEWGLEPIAHYEEPYFTPVSQPKLYEKYPLILATGRRSPVYFHSEHRNIPWLREVDPDPIIEIHPDTARSNSIANGDWVWVENWLGKCMFKVKTTLVVPTWMVMAAHAWWFPEEPGEEPSLFGVWKSNVSQLIPMGSQGKDGLGAPTKHMLCKIYKANGREEG